MKCKISNLSDIPNIIRCHKSAFPDALSSKLGYRFTTKMFEWYILNERGVLFHIMKNGSIIGYCAGIKTEYSGLDGAFTSITQFAFRTFILSYLLRPWLLFHRETIKKFSSIKRNILLRLGKKQVIQVNSEFEPYLGLIVIGVKKEMHGKGIGLILLKEFENIAFNLGFNTIVLSVKSNNKKAISAYIKSQWIKTEESKDSLIMKKTLKI